MMIVASSHDLRGSVLVILFDAIFSFFAVVVLVPPGADDPARTVKRWKLLLLELVLWEH
jgi:hypothetical protein